MNFFTLFCLFFIRYKCIAIDLDDINLLNCTDDSPCEESTLSTSPFTQNSNDSMEKSNDKNPSSFIEGRKFVNTTKEITQTIQQSLSTTEMTVITTTMRNDVERKMFTKMHSDSCTCDLKISSCDVNCCCDVDCSDFQMTSFSRCDDHRPKKYDSRYCYTKNFIQRNNTRFIIERIASNLFCIAYDNLPPIYSMSDVAILKNRQAFESAKYSINSQRFTWHFDDLIIPSDLNFSSHYRHKEALWKFHHNVVELMELPQSGFTGECTFTKKIEYLETSRWRCMQTDLSNDNFHLFAKIYNDFTIISSPHLFNKSYITSDNPDCPENVCLRQQTFYCSKSWRTCNSAKPPAQSCSRGKCRNVVQSMRYTIFHNGTSGIRNIETRFILADVTQNFYQNFEIIHEWTTYTEEEQFSRSGNVGYAIGKPIIIGYSASNLTKDAKNDYITINRSDYHLTLPLRGKNGDCSSSERHVVAFGENSRSSCNIHKEINPFSSSLACMNLQNETLRLMMKNFLRDVTMMDNNRVYVSKTGDFTTTKNISTWTQIFLDKVPSNVVTGQIFNGKIRCSALVTTINIEILYTKLKDNDKNDYHRIAGVALNFSEAKDASWNKCLEKNCSDVINVELTSLVTFIDISKPSMYYYYAGGPNLDITLPYDFFYPFMNSASDRESSFNVLLVIQLMGLILYHS